MARSVVCVLRSRRCRQSHEALARRVPPACAAAPSNSTGRYPADSGGSGCYFCALASRTSSFSSAAAMSLSLCPLFVSLNQSFRTPLSPDSCACQNAVAPSGSAALLRASRPRLSADSPPAAALPLRPASSLSCAARSRLRLSVESSSALVASPTCLQQPLCAACADIFCSSSLPQPRWSSLLSPQRPAGLVAGSSPAGGLGWLQTRAKCDVAALPPWKRWLPKQRARLGAVAAAERSGGEADWDGPGAAPAADIRGLLLLANSSLVQRIQTLQRSGQLRLRRLPPPSQGGGRKGSRQAPAAPGDGAGGRRHPHALPASEQDLEESNDTPRPLTRRRGGLGVDERGAAAPFSGGEAMSTRASAGATDAQQGQGGRGARAVAVPSAVTEASSTLPSSRPSGSASPSPSPFFVVVPWSTPETASESAPTVLLPNFRALLGAARAPAEAASQDASSPSSASAGAAVVAAHLAEYLAEVVPFLPELAASSASSVRDAESGAFAAAVLRALLVQSAAFLDCPLSSGQALAVLMAFAALSPAAPFEGQHMPHQLEQARHQRQLRILQPVLSQPSAKRIFDELLRVACSQHATPSATQACGEESEGVLRCAGGFDSGASPALVSGVPAFSARASFALPPEPVQPVELPAIDDAAVLPLLEAYWRLQLRQPEALAALLNCVASEQVWLDERQLVRLCSFLAYYERPGLDAAVAIEAATRLKQKQGRDARAAGDSAAPHSESRRPPPARVQGEEQLPARRDAGSSASARGAVAAAVFRVFDLVGARLAGERFAFFSDDDIGDLCRALVQLKRNHDRLLDRQARWRLAGAAGAAAGASAQRDDATAKKARGPAHRAREKEEASWCTPPEPRRSAAGGLAPHQNPAHLEPLAAYFSVWRRPLGAALERQLPLTLHDFRYWNLIDLGEMIAEFRTDNADSPAMDMGSSETALGGATGSRSGGELVTAPGMFGYHHATGMEALVAADGKGEGRDLAQRIASEVWKFSIMMRFGYTGKALMVLHKLDVGDPRTQRSLLRHVTKLFGFDWAGTFFAELTVAAASAAYRAGLPVSRQKKGVHVAGWRFYNNLALYLLRPVGVADAPPGEHAQPPHADRGLSSSEPRILEVETQAAEDGEEGEGDESSLEGNEGNLGAVSGEVLLAPQSQRPVTLKKKRRLLRVIDTVSSPLLCCEIAAAFARLRVPQAALLHAIVDRAESEGRGWMHLQHLISLARDMQEVSVHSDRLLNLLLDEERQKAELASCSPAALALLPLLLGRIRGWRPIHVPTLVRLHQLLLDDSATFPATPDFFSDKDVEWRKTLRAAAQYLTREEGASKPEGQGRSPEAERAWGGAASDRARHSPELLGDSGEEAADHAGQAADGACGSSQASTSFVSAVSPLPVRLSGETKTVRVARMQDEKAAGAAAAASAAAAQAARRENDLDALVMVASAFKGEGRTQGTAGEDAARAEANPSGPPESAGACTGPERTQRRQHSCLDGPIQTCAALFSQPSPGGRSASSADAEREPSEAAAAALGDGERPRRAEAEATKSTPGLPGLRLALFSVDDVVVLLRGLELARCCSGPLALRVVQVLEARKAEVTAGHLPALLSGLVSLAAGEELPLEGAVRRSESGGGDAEATAALGAQAGPTALQPAAVAAIAEGLIHDHVGALSDEEIPTCIWAAYALGIRAPGSSSLEAFGGRRIINVSNSDSGDLRGQSSQPGGLVKLIRRFLGASLNVSGPLLHLLQVVAVCLRLDALKNPHLQQPEEIARFAQLLDATPRAALACNQSLGGPGNSLSVRSLLAQSASPRDRYGDGSRGQAGTSQAWTVRTAESGGGQSTARADPPAGYSPETIATSFTEATRIRGLRLREAAAASLKKSGVQSVADLPFYPFSIDLAFTRACAARGQSETGLSLAIQEHTNELSSGLAGYQGDEARGVGSQQLQARGADGDAEYTSPISLSGFAKWGTGHSEGDGRRVAALSSSAPAPPPPPQPVHSHSWQVPDAGFKLNTAFQGAGEHAFSGGATQRYPGVSPRHSLQSLPGGSAYGGSPVAVFVAGSRRSLCMSDLHLLQTRSVRAPLPQSGMEAPTASRICAKEQRPAVASDRERDPACHSTEQGEWQSEPGDAVLDGSPAGLDEHAMRPGSNTSGVQLVSGRHLMRSGWRLGPYEQLRERVLRDFGWEVYYLLAV
ncbi:hypothetical protein BESB_031320 [Besnoitia besnoiti]|uniref:Uncharacterized protein n=1 Tax=Besnoitia besnoiti TaxID=94643 RepID=A0A2A9LXQ0_BESBE|nr:hypothetical protein BESB_031320 [Besnoitia besnoiti]PFH31258.1 hypothetical protein BESB_031320 [Besnoitia besnoiti]